MDGHSIQLAGSTASGSQLANGVFRLTFDRALILKTMTGSAEKTLWWQAGDLVLEGVTAVTPLLEGPATLVSGDLDDNIYTYRDMIPIPLDSRGNMRCLLRFAERDDPLIVAAEVMRLELLDQPRYIKHLRPSD